MKMEISIVALLFSCFHVFSLLICFDQTDHHRSLNSSSRDILSSRNTIKTVRLTATGPELTQVWNLFESHFPPQV